MIRARLALEARFELPRYDERLDAVGDGARPAAHGVEDLGEHLEAQERRVEWNRQPTASAMFGDGRMLPP